MRILTLSTLLLISTAPVFAGETPWQEVAPQVRVRLISSDQLSPGDTTMAAVEIDMPANMKTYWRVPGETGIPMELDLSRATGIAGHKVIWPYPTIDQSSGYLDYVYFGPVVLPVELAMSGEDAVLDANLLLGVCSDICMPVSARFVLPLSFAAPDKGHGLRIRQAMANTPLDWPAGPQPIGDVQLSADGETLSVWISDPQIDRASMIAAMGHGQTLFGVPQKSPEPNLVVLPVLGNVDEKTLEGQEVTLIFTTPMGPFEIARRIVPNSGKS